MKIISPDTAKILFELLGVGILFAVIAAVNLITQAKARP